MASEPTYEIRCDCGAGAVTLSGAPIVHAYCHCQDCRDLLNVPASALAAWDSDDARIARATERLIEYQ